jgi:hypothetical protein
MAGSHNGLRVRRLPTSLPPAAHTPQAVRQHASLLRLIAYAPAPHTDRSLPRAGRLAAALPQAGRLSGSHHV